MQLECIANLAPNCTPGSNKDVPPNQIKPHNSPGRDCVCLCVCVCVCVCEKERKNTRFPVGTNIF